MRHIKYQDDAIKTLSAFLEKVNTLDSIPSAWKQHWMERDLNVGFGSIQPYNNTVPGVPYVCMKVPTGGGKTFMACRAVKPIFSFMPPEKPRVVIWLVPSDAILSQTIDTLKDPAHEYRRQLDTDFSGRVSILTKDELLNGTNFSPDSVRETLTICVFSYASLRINASSKDARKVYQENGNLMQFAEYFHDPDLLLADTPDTALIQVLRQLTPLVVVDESHNAGSDLSVEMLQRLNPHFILALSATPRPGTNTLVFVDAKQLKDENMVKLPVVVYNRSSRELVINDAIQLQARLEQYANIEKTRTGRYIRPIVLFQAQPNIKGKENETYNIIRQKLIDKGIPAEQIAIKTSKIDELGKTKLMDPNCPIRFIITVNALKEGWDCPFAYILASLANKTSRFDVEQILGRVLRQPYQTKMESPYLNNAYVLTSSNDFRQVLDSIVSGMNRAGFSRKEVIPLGQDEHSDDTPAAPEPSPQFTLDDFSDVSDEPVISPTAVAGGSTVMDGSQEGNGEPISAAADIDNMLQFAAQETEKYEEASRNSLQGFMGGELGDMMNQNEIRPEFQNDLPRLPQFYYDSEPDLFGDGTTLLEREHLSEGFTLANQDAKINFDMSTGKMYTVDVDDDSVPKYKRATASQYKWMQDSLARTASEKVVERCIIDICAIINRNDRLVTTDVNGYVRRIVSNMTEEQVNALQTDRFMYADRIKEKIADLEDKYREEQFYKWLEIEKLYTREAYAFPPVITPLETIDSVPHSLYTAEKSDMNGFERDVLDMIASLPNIKWWHRVIDSNKKEFRLNGFINHYPDFVVMFQSGRVALIETKGDHLANDDSRRKLKLGRKWASMAGRKYRYFMVFNHEKIDAEGAYTLDDIVGVLKEL